MAMTGDDTEQVPRPFDRRSALKKAAAAGAIIWAAPTIVSTQAAAQGGTFTPKCGATIPVRGSNRFTVNGTCNGAGGADWRVAVYISITQGDCACSTPTVDNGGLDAEGPDSVGPLPLRNKTYDRFSGEWKFFYQGRGETGLFESPVFAAVLRCTDRDGDERVYRDTATIEISENCS